MRIEAKHDYSAIEVEAIEDGLYEYNRSAVGAHDGRTLGYVLRDSAGALLAQRLDIHGPVSPSLSSYGSMKDTVVGDTGERC